MALNPWKILDSHYIHPRFRIDKVELVNGKVFEPVVFEFRNWANVVALTKDNEVVLVRQYRHGVREFSLEFPGGIVDDDEIRWRGCASASRSTRTVCASWAPIATLAT